MHIAEQRRRTLLKDFHDTWSNCKTPASPLLPCPLPPLLPSMTISRCSHTDPPFRFSAFTYLLLPFFPSSHSHNAAGSQNGTIVSPPPPLIFILTSHFGFRTSLSLVVAVESDHKSDVLRTCHVSERTGLSFMSDHVFRYWAAKSNMSLEGFYSPNFIMVLEYSLDENKLLFLSRWCRRDSWNKCSLRKLNWFCIW